MSRPKLRLQVVLHAVFLATGGIATVLGLLMIWGVEPSLLVVRVVGTPRDDARIVVGVVPARRLPRVPSIARGRQDLEQAIIAFGSSLDSLPWHQHAD